MAEQKKEEYDGPYIEKRLEWKSPDRKRHNVVLFGSWNRFEGGDELEYQGKQIFAVNVKLPLGTYKYRFLIDDEEWKTHLGEQQTAINGIQYNQIYVAEHFDKEQEDDEFNQDQHDEEEEDDKYKENTTLIMRVDGRLTVGKKNRARPHMKLEYFDSVVNGDDLDESKENDDDNNNEHRKKKKKKRKKKTSDQQENKEWARYVFVQQLRMQQQHNDEVNRVKILWKQERRVRVEMHKKVVKQLKQRKNELQEQTVEIQRLTKQLAIGKRANLEQSSNAETKMQELEINLEAERQRLQNEKKNHEAIMAMYVEKEERMNNRMKSLVGSNGVAALRDDIKSIQEEQISQLEEMDRFFSGFGSELTKIFKFNETLLYDLLMKYKKELSLKRDCFNMTEDLCGNNIGIFCRFRPLLPYELKKNYTNCVRFPEEGSLKIVDDKGKTLNFEFDKVYTPRADQAQISEDVTEYIESVMDGYNVSIFGYGETGSGKTYTMEGPRHNPGVNLRALKYLFKISEERAPHFEYKIKISIFEIYNEKIKDLIVGAEEKDKAYNKKKGEDLKIRHLPDGSVQIDGLTKVSVSNDEDIMKLNQMAKKNRSVLATDMNAHCSRSHMLLVVDVSGINKLANIKYFGKLYLVDLAGSERVKKSGATDQTLKEAQNVNKSLSALGDVIQALQKKEKYIGLDTETV